MSVRPSRREDALPEVVGLEPVRVRRVARAVVPAQVEGQEPRALALEVRAEAHLVLVHREVHHAAAELEQLLARVAVALVLLDGVGDRLLGQAVLQLEGGDRQAVDEQAQVERALRLVAAVAELARDAEAVGRVALGGLGVARRRRAVEEVDVVRAVLDPVAQHVDDAALADLALQPREELAPRRAVLAEVERLGDVRLRLAQEGRELREVDAVLAVVVLGRAADPAGAVGRGPLTDSQSTASRPGSQGEPVSAVQISRSRPRSLVSVCVISKLSCRARAQESNQGTNVAPVKPPGLLPALRAAQMARCAF